MSSGIGQTRQQKELAEDAELYPPSKREDDGPEPLTTVWSVSPASWSVHSLFLSFFRSPLLLPLVVPRG